MLWLRALCVPAIFLPGQRRVDASGFGARSLSRLVFEFERVHHCAQPTETLRRLVNPEWARKRLNAARENICKYWLRYRSRTSVNARAAESWIVRRIL